MPILHLHLSLFKGLSLVDVLIKVLLFQDLEEKIIVFVKSELKALKEDLRPGSSQVPEKQRHEDEVVDAKEAEQRRTDKADFLRITLSFLRKMKQDLLADSLQTSKCTIGAVTLATRETRTVLQGCG